MLKFLAQWDRGTLEGVEAGAAADRGRNTALRGMLFLQRPRPLSFVVRWLR